MREVYTMHITLDSGMTGSFELTKDQFSLVKQFDFFSLKLEGKGADLFSGDNNSIGWYLSKASMIDIIKNGYTIIRIQLKFEY